jgi:TPR repeat protein
VSGGPPILAEGLPVAPGSALAAAWQALAAIHDTEGDGAAYRAAVASYEGLRAELHRLALVRGEIMGDLADPVRGAFHRARLEEQREAVEGQIMAIIDKESPNA